MAAAGGRGLGRRIHLVVLAPIIGQTRVIAVAPKLASATGYDVDAALEAFP